MSDQHPLYVIQWCLVSDVLPEYEIWQYREYLSFLGGSIADCIF